MNATLSLEFSNLMTRYLSPEHDYQIYLGVEANFEVKVNGHTLLRQPYFCVVELAMHLCQWLKNPSPDFCYTSLEAEEEGLLWVRHENGGCRIGSVWQEYEERGVLPCRTVIEVLKQFVRKVHAHVQHELNIDILGLLESGLPQQ